MSVFLIMLSMSYWMLRMREISCTFSFLKKSTNYSSTLMSNSQILRSRSCAPPSKCPSPSLKRYQSPSSIFIRLCSSRSTASEFFLSPLFILCSAATSLRMNRSSSSLYLLSRLFLLLVSASKVARRSFSMALRSARCARMACSTGSRACLRRSASLAICSLKQRTWWMRSLMSPLKLVMILEQRGWSVWISLTFCAARVIARSYCSSASTRSEIDDIRQFITSKFFRWYENTWVTFGNIYCITIQPPPPNTTAHPPNTTAHPPNTMPQRHQQVILMRNFIRHNIENVKGKKTVSIERENPKQSHVNRTLAPRNPISMAQRVSDLERRVTDIETGPQQEIIEQLSAIKDDIRLIKSHIFDRKFHSSEKQLTQDSQEEDVKQRMRSQNSEPETKTFERSHPSSSKHLLSDLIQTRLKKSHSNYHRGSMNLKTICSMVRDYKFEDPDFGTVFYGYSKRNSQPVALKYAAEGLGGVLEVYDRLWKNIAKAKWPCVNRVLDFKREDSTYMIIERNRGSIVGLPPKSLLIDILKILEFIHDCGYLYRNIEPEHFMINEEGQLVAIDFKRALRYVDIRGHPLEVVDQFNGSPFASNNQLRGLPESRKDDLESLGYLALLLLELDIPWMNATKEQAIKIRCSLTLQELYKTNIRWVEYMANVIKIPKGERPDYRHLLEILELS